MKTQDSIADLLVSLQNAQRAGLKFFYNQYSNEKVSILNILYYNGYITGFFSHIVSNKKKILIIFPKYINFIPVIKKIFRLSKPSIRRYIKVIKLTKFLKQFGIMLISSSFGVINSFDAFFLHCSGEILCFVE